jgi:predicted enzyme related to lactoylglutathione lyase
MENGWQLLIPKMTIPKVGWFAQCMDTEKNRFGIVEMGENTGWHTT